MRADDIGAPILYGTVFDTGYPSSMPHSFGGLSHGVANSAKMFDADTNRGVITSQPAALALAGLPCVDDGLQVVCSVHHHQRCRRTCGTRVRPSSTYC